MTMISLMCAGGLPDTNIFLDNWETIARQNGGPARATFRLNSDRGVYNGEDHTYDFQSWFTIWNGPYAYWCAPGGTPADYEARATVIEGALDAGSAAAGAWLNLGTTRDWKMASYAITSMPVYGSILLEIRKAATGRIVKTATITFNMARIG